LGRARRGGAGTRLRRGERQRVIEAEGGQSGDLATYAADGSEPISNGRTFDYGGKIDLSAGDVLTARLPVLPGRRRADGRGDRARHRCQRRSARAHAVRRLLQRLRPTVDAAGFSLRSV
jgi:uncharacterized protein YcgI (DUF1989 family)